MLRGQTLTTDAHLVMYVRRVCADFKNLNVVIIQLKCLALKAQQITSGFNISDCVFDTFTATTLIAIIQLQSVYLDSSFNYKFSS